MTPSPICSMWRRLRPSGGFWDVWALIGHGLPPHSPRHKATGGDELADRLERALADQVKLLALTIDERAIILAALDDPPDGLSELRGVLLNEHQWRQGEGLDP